MYSLIPHSGHITVVPLKPSEVKEYTGKLLSDVETSGMDVLQYGRVVAVGRPPRDIEIAADDMPKSGGIVLYPRLASDKTNFGDPRQVIVEVGHIKAYLQEIK